MLFNDGVQMSDCIVLLATKGVLTRPWCLLELHEAVRHAIPVIVLPVAQRGFEFDEARLLISELETRLPQLNSGALAELERVLGTSDLTELKSNVLQALARQRVDTLFSQSREDLASASQHVPRRLLQHRPSSTLASAVHALSAALARQRRSSTCQISDALPPTVIARRTSGAASPKARASPMATHAPSSVTTGTLRSSSNPARASSMPSCRSTDLQAVPERTRIQLRLQWRPNGTNNQVLADLTDLCERMAFVTGRTLTWERHPLQNTRSSSGTNDSDRSVSVVEATSRGGRVAHDDEAVSSVGIAYCEEEAERVSAYLSRKLTDSGRSVRALAHGSELAGGVEHAGRPSIDALLLLQTKCALRSPHVLLQVYVAVLQDVPVVPVVLKDHGYDFEKSKAGLSQLSTELDAAALTELEALLRSRAAALKEEPHSIDDLARALLEHIPQLISLQFNPLGTAADVMGSLADLQLRITEAERASAARNMSPMAERSESVVLRVSLSSPKDAPPPLPPASA